MTGRRGRDSSSDPVFTRRHPAPHDRGHRLRSRAGRDHADFMKVAKARLERHHEVGDGMTMNGNKNGSDKPPPRQEAQGWKILKEAMFREDRDSYEIGRNRRPKSTGRRPATGGSAEAGKKGVARCRHRVMQELPSAKRTSARTAKRRMTKRRVCDLRLIDNARSKEQKQGLSRSSIKTVPGIEATHQQERRYHTLGDKGNTARLISRSARRNWALIKNCLEIRPG